MNTAQIARVCHETNRAYCETIGDSSQKPWDQADQWQRESAIRGVEFVLANPDATPRSLHEAWMKDKLDQGWVFGAVKDPELKQHPCLVDYSELAADQRIKDYLFRGVIWSFRQGSGIDR